MTPGQKRRAEYFLRSSLEIASEARGSFQKKRLDRVVRKAHESVELFVKALLLQKGVEPAKSHDLSALAAPVMSEVGIEEIDLDFLTEQRIPAFYGADDFIPDQEYSEEEALRCISILNRIFPENPQGG